MKVKDLIAELQTLDQEKDISILYDCVAKIKPRIEMAGEDESPIKEGDYFFQAW